MRLAKPRLAWLWLYVGVNLVAAAIMYSSGELIGDPKGNPLYDVAALIAATTMVVLSYVLILGPLFNFLDRIKIEPLRLHGQDEVTGKRIGQVLLVLQLAYIAFNLAAGVNIAGSNSTGTNSQFAVFWVLVPADMLFFIYYGTYREHRYFYPNAAVWLVSNLMRGWAGMYGTVLFFEACRALRQGRLKLGTAVIGAVSVIALYPVLTNLKWLFRLSASGLPLDEIVTSLLENSDGVDYFSVVGEGISHIVGRLQVTSLVVEVMRLSDLLQAKFAAGEFAPYWAEGLHGIIYDRLFVGEKSLSIGVAFTQYGSFDWDTSALGDWNTNIGWVGWFFIAPFQMPVYVLYTCLLAFLSMYLVKKNGMSEAGRDMLWYAWLVYLLPPWFAVFTNFIYALIVFLVIKVVVAPAARRAPEQITGQNETGGAHV